MFFVTLWQGILPAFISCLIFGLKNIKKLKTAPNDLPFFALPARRQHGQQQNKKNKKNVKEEK